MAEAPRSVVAVCSVKDTVRDAVREAMELADWRAHVPVDTPVALKPNLCWDLPLPGVQTSPWFLEAVIEVLKSRVTDLVVVEAGQVTVDADLALHRCGLDRVLERQGVPFVNMSRGSFGTVHLPTGAVLHQVELPDVLNGRLLITLPVLKTHATTTITGALKNQWGCLRELRHNHHLVVDRAIADVNVLVRPVFAVMDGTIGLEGDGPKTGRPRACDLVLASADLSALDATAARIMGLDPTRIAHIVEASARGLGELEEGRIELVGESASPLEPPFAPARRGLVQRTEFALRRSPLRRLAFETRALSALAFGAKVHNAAWYACAGRRRRRRILSDTRYGPQWLFPDASEPTSGAR